MRAVVREHADQIGGVVGEETEAAFALLGLETRAPRLFYIAPHHGQTAEHDGDGQAEAGQQRDARLRLGTASDPAVISERGLLAIEHFCGLGANAIHDLFAAAVANDVTVSLIASRIATVWLTAAAMTRKRWRLRCAVSPAPSSAKRANSHRTRL